MRLRAQNDKLYEFALDSSHGGGRRRDGERSMPFMAMGLHICGQCREAVGGSGEEGLEHGLPLNYDFIWSTHTSSTGKGGRKSGWTQIIPIIWYMQCYVMFPWLSVCACVCLCVCWLIFLRFLLLLPFYPIMFIKSAFEMSSGKERILSGGKN